ncbi:MAG: hypothetical protein ACJ768_12425 [Gaiellaceae bacterium]
MKDFDLFEGLLFAPQGDARDGRINGYGGRDDSGHILNLTITYRLDGDDSGLELRADRRDPIQYPSWAQLHMITSRVLSNAIHREGLTRFPIDLRIERESLTVRVNGRARKMTVYSCGDAASATLKVGDASVSITGPRHVLASLSLRSLERAEFDDFVRKNRAWRAEHRAALRESKRRRK